MVEHVFTGFGFGPIQGGLFAKEAFESGNFARIVVAEIDAELVGAVKANNGSYLWAVPSLDTSNVKIRVTAVDKAGNTTASTSDIFTVDATKPVVTPDSTSVSTSDPTPQISGRIDGTGSPIVLVQYRVGDGEWQGVSFEVDPSDSNSVLYNFTTSLLPGAYTIEMSAEDSAGNTISTSLSVAVVESSDSGSGGSSRVTLYVLGIVFLGTLVIVGIAYFGIRRSKGGLRGLIRR